MSKKRNHANTIATMKFAHEHIILIDVIRRQPDGKCRIEYIIFHKNGEFDKLKSIRYGDDMLKAFRAYGTMIVDSFSPLD